NDSLLVFGSPAAGAVDERLTVGPDADSGTLVSRTASAPAQTVQFAALEALVDTSTAASLTLAGSDARNVVELTSGPLAGGVTQTATARFFDVVPCQSATMTQPAAPQPVTVQDAAGQLAGSHTAAPPAAPAAAAPTPAAVDPRDPAARREAKRLAKEAKRQAKLLAKEAKRRAQESKRAAAALKKRGGAKSAPAAAPPTPAPAPAPA